jgi:hypothetical protein
MDPVEHRRPTARSIIGDRSCASSRTTCPTLGVRSIRSATSSTSTASATLQRAAPGLRAWLAPRQRRLLRRAEHFIAAAARAAGSESSRHTTRGASILGQSASTYARTGRDLATVSWTRSSGASPSSSMRTSTACASRCANMARPAP